MKYPIFSLLGLVLVGSSCFNPHIKEGGFACSGSQAGQCPNGYVCVNNVCVDNPAAAPGPGGVGGNGQTGNDMTMSTAPDLARPTMSMPDLARPAVVVDMAMRVPPDLSQPPPPADMAKGSTCAHSPCKTGNPLNASCDPCVTVICQNDATCCDPNSIFGWDSLCVGDVQTYCTTKPAGC